MKVYVFGKRKCAGCEETKQIIEKYLLTSKYKLDFIFHDMDTIEGMVEGANCHVSLVPTTIITCGDNLETATHLARWDGVVPDLSEIESAIIRGASHAISH